MPSLHSDALIVQRRSSAHAHVSERGPHGHVSQSRAHGHVSPCCVMSCPCLCCAQPMAGHGGDSRVSVPLRSALCTQLKKCGSKSRNSTISLKATNGPGHNATSSTTLFGSRNLGQFSLCWAGRDRQISTDTEIMLNAAKFGAYVIFLEHRFYGESHLSRSRLDTRRPTRTFTENTTLLP